MKYLGSKARIAKHILPIMLKKMKEKGLTNWVEPFVGGGNMIDKVPSNINRFGYDVSEHTIGALIAVRDFVDSLPDNITEDYYKKIIRTEYKDPVESWVRFVCSVGGKFDNGYARDKTQRNYASEGKRNALKQSPGLQDVLLECKDFKELQVNSSLIYCDPPYKGTTGYKTAPFDYDSFYNWCRAMAKAGNIVFVSEYNMPDDFMQVWMGEIKTNLASQRKKYTNLATEKLFLLESC